MADGLYFVALLHGVYRPGKHGKPGNLREINLLWKTQGNLREFYNDSGKMRGTGSEVSYDHEVALDYRIGRKIQNYQSILKSCNWSRTFEFYVQMKDLTI